MNPIKVPCRECGMEAPADQFKLHYKYKKMVCPACFSGRTEIKRQKEQEETVVKKEKPAGWDSEDDYLEKMSRTRRQDGIEVSQFSKIPGTHQVQCKCAHCKFNFKYDPFKKTPRTCPYCNQDVPRLTTFNLL